MLLSVAMLTAVAVLPQQQARMDSVVIQEWKVPWERTRPRDPSVDKDGIAWFVGQAGHYIGRLDPKSGEITRFPLDSGTGPHSQIVGSDGNIWYTGNRANHIGKLDPKTGKITKYPTPEGVRDPHTMIEDKNGNMWFTAQQSQYVGRFNPKTNKMDVIKMDGRKNPYGIAIDSKGNVWFNEFATNAIGKLDPNTMELTEYPLPNERTRDRRIGITSDDMIWYTDYSRGMIGRLNPQTKRVDEWPLPGGPTSLPYGMTIDDKDRIWVAEVGKVPTGGEGAKVRIVGFDAKDCSVFSETWVPSGGGTIRHMIFDKNAREVWFGTDANTIGRFKVPN
jgi:virginiamycin B lyase